MMILFFCSANIAYSARISFPLPSRVEAISKMSLEDIFGNLKINTRKLTEDEIRFLSDSMEKNSLWMINDEKVKNAILNGPSSYAEQVYRRIFFYRLDLWNETEMSMFFAWLFVFQKSAYDKISKARISQEDALYDENNVAAWKKVTQGIVYAIKQGDFGISLSDFHALYANFTSKNIMEFIGETHEMSEKGRVAMYEIWKFIQGTSTEQRIREGSRPLDITYTVFRLHNQYGLDIMRAAPGSMEITSSIQLSKREREILKIQDKMFSSPFYDPSNEILLDFFITTVARNQFLLHKETVLTMWTSGKKRIRDMLRRSLHMTVVTAKVADGDIYENLGRNKFYQAMIEAGNENEEIRILVDDELRTQMLL